MNKRLYVGGLSYGVDDDSLRALFEPHGDVKFVKVIRDFHSGRSKGFGFVEMNTPDEAKEAIENLNGSMHEARSITVSEANPPDSSGGSSRGSVRTGGSGGSGGGGYQRRRSGGGSGMGGSGGGNGGGHRHREREEY